MKIFILFIAFIFMETLNAQLTFDGNIDLGKVKIPGSAVFDSVSQTYTLEGSGKNIWYNNDEFHFLYKKLKGDFILTATVEFVGNGVDPHRKIGWMLRNSLDTSSVQACAVIHGDGLTSLQFRKEQGTNMNEVRSEITAPDVVELERSGNLIKMRVAKYGDPYTTTETNEVLLNSEVYAGLFICSHNPDVKETALFKNVRITIPADKDFIPYTDYIGSRLETIEIETGLRKVLYTTPDGIEAPDWTHDGKYLIYNSKGKLYKFEIAAGDVTQINTGFAIKNNNDHVLSFDGKHLGISHHSADDNGVSIIYSLPVEGSDNPKRITSKGPSYLHGWSPDKKYMIFTGGRNDQYDIYKIDISTGEETQLTNNTSLDDGSEYTPDGGYIYFNSTRSGKMQIWRMKPNGSEQEQITNDEFNNWFPHISPDGKWIVFLSYGDDVKPDDHPYYKHVYLRIMPFEGGNPRTIAYLYGGQGTINVPSWSPDSKRVAFVSNTKLLAE